MLFTVHSDKNTFAFQTLKKSVWHYHFSASSKAISSADYLSYAKITSWINVCYNNTKQCRLKWLKICLIADLFPQQIHAIEITWTIKTTWNIIKNHNIKSPQQTKFCLIELFVWKEYISSFHLCNDTNLENCTQYTLVLWFYPLLMGDIQF